MFLPFKAPATTNLPCNSRGPARMENATHAKHAIEALNTNKKENVVDNVRGNITAMKFPLKRRDMPVHTTTRVWRLDTW